ncbi:DEAD/DEAH box helicase [Nonomuraea antimicrobica]
MLDTAMPALGEPSTEDPAQVSAETPAETSADTSTGSPAAASAEQGGPSEFELLGLPKPLVNGLARLGFDSPFPIQSATIPDVLAGNDVLGRGQTGSGKTLAFGLPTMARIAGVKPAPAAPAP